MFVTGELVQMLLNTLLTNSFKQEITSLNFPVIDQNFKKYNIIKKRNLFIQMHWTWYQSAWVVFN